VEEQGKRHKKKMSEWAWQLLSLVRRWRHPEREEIVAVADGGGTRLVKTLPDRCRSLSNPITFITRLRLDALPSMNRRHLLVPVVR
jgi:hypothetical protein